MKRESRRNKFILILCLIMAILFIAIGYAFLLFVLGSFGQKGGAGRFLHSSKPVNEIDAFWMGGVAIAIACHLGFVAFRAWRDFDKDSK